MSWHSYDVIVSTGADVIGAACAFVLLSALHRRGCRRLDAFRVAEEARAERAWRDGRLVAMHLADEDVARREQRTRGGVG